MNDQQTKVHDLKTDPEVFQDMLTGKKQFEVRRNDRDFKTGDYLVLREHSPQGFTGREEIKCVRYIMEGGKYGVESGYVVMGLES